MSGATAVVEVADASGGRIARAGKPEFRERVVALGTPRSVHLDRGAATAAGGVGPRHSLEERLLPHHLPPRQAQSAMVV